MRVIVSVALLYGVALGGCRKDPSSSQTAANVSMVRARATIEAKSGSNVTGTAILEEVAGGVKVTVNIHGADAGDHGIHIHQKGDCSADNGKSAGGHFNPKRTDHALPPAGVRHLGDLGNITVDEQGNGSLEIVRHGANLKRGDPLSFLGRAIILHAKQDTGAQPTGAAGARIGCGAITGW